MSDFFSEFGQVSGWVINLASDQGDKEIGGNQCRIFAVVLPNTGSENPIIKPQKLIICNHSDNDLMRVGFGFGADPTTMNIDPSRRQLNGLAATDPSFSGMLPELRYSDEIAANDYEFGVTIPPESTWEFDIPATYLTYEDSTTLITTRAFYFAIGNFDGGNFDEYGVTVSGEGLITAT